MPCGAAGLRRRSQKGARPVRGGSKGRRETSRPGFLKPLPEVSWRVHIGIMQIDQILENFEFLDDWEDRYRYLIELGRTLEPLPDQGHKAANKGQGCAGQGWLGAKVTGGGDGRAILQFLGARRA